MNDEARLNLLDALVEQPKTIVGVVHWSHDHSRSGIQAFKAILAINGDDRSGLSLSGRARFGLQTSFLQLSFTCLQAHLMRMSFTPETAHTNAFLEHCPPHLRGQSFPRGVTRLYRWSNNRVLPYPRTAEIAELPAIEIHTVASAIAYMLQQSNIIGTIPEPLQQSVLL